MQSSRVALLFCMLALAFCSYVAAKHRRLRTTSLDGVCEEMRLVGEIYRKYNCTFCHVTENRDPQCIDDPKRNCAACHSGRDNVRYMGANLDALGAKLKPQWLRGFLKKPTVVRHYMMDIMPDFRLSEHEIDTLVNHFCTHAKPLPPVDESFFVLRTDPLEHSELLKSGEELAEKFACLSCHDFTGHVKIDRQVLSKGPYYKHAAYFATDLRYVRQRMEPSAAFYYVLNPFKVDPASRMPECIGMTEEAARVLTYWMLYAEVDPLAQPAEPWLDEIHWAVKTGAMDAPPADPDFERDIVPLINRYCMICHYRKESTIMGRATGFAGAFGFPARHYYVTTRKGLFAEGRVNERGEPEPVIIPGDLQSILLKRLRGEIYPAMPFGMAISKEAVQTFENWIKNGAKVPDGFDRFIVHMPGQRPDFEED